MCYAGVIFAYAARAGVIYVNYPVRTLPVFLKFYQKPSISLDLTPAVWGLGDASVL
jgi:hypothetical protein